MINAARSNFIKAARRAPPSGLRFRVPTALSSPLLRPAAQTRPVFPPGPAPAPIRTLSTSAIRLNNFGAVIEAGDKDLDTILSETEESSTVIVDFYADWCGPCRVLAPILAQAVKENGKTFLVKVNVDVHEETAAKYQIASLPTVAAFRNGKIVGTFIGSRDKNFVGKFIAEHTSA